LNAPEIFLPPAPRAGPSFARLGRALITAPAASAAGACNRAPDWEKSPATFHPGKPVKIRLKFCMTDPLNARLKTLIVTTLKLDGVRPDDIPDDEPLIGSPRFGLDSIDALELVLVLEKEFGVKIGSSEESRKALACINSLAAFLRTNQPRA
jgi:acyl carrier protein